MSEKEATTGASVTYLSLLAELADVLPDFMDWATVWHAQSGGYTASDTAMTILKMERAAKKLAEWKSANTQNSVQPDAGRTT